MKTLTIEKNLDLCFLIDLTPALNPENRKYWLKLINILFVHLYKMAYRARVMVHLYCGKEWFALSDQFEYLDEPPLWTDEDFDIMDLSLASSPIDSLHALAFCLNQCRKAEMQDLFSSSSLQIFWISSDASTDAEARDIAAIRHADVNVSAYCLSPEDSFVKSLSDCTENAPRVFEENMESSLYCFAAVRDEIESVLYAYEHHPGMMAGHTGISVPLS